MIKEEEEEEEEKEEAHNAVNENSPRVFRESRHENRSKNRVTRSTELRTSSARAGFAWWIDRRRGSIGEGREARAYGRVVPVWACKKH